MEILHVESYRHIGTETIMMPSSSCTLLESENDYVMAHNAVTVSSIEEVLCTYIVSRDRKTLIAEKNNPDNLTPAIFYSQAYLHKKGQKYYIKYYHTC